MRECFTTADRETRVTRYHIATPKYPSGRAKRWFGELFFFRSWFLDSCELWVDETHNQNHHNCKCQAEIDKGKPAGRRTSPLRYVPSRTRSWDWLGTWGTTRRPRSFSRGIPSSSPAMIPHRGTLRYRDFGMVWIADWHIKPKEKISTMIPVLSLHFE